MWRVEILFHGIWYPLTPGYLTQGDAEWATAQFKQDNNITTDPFRAREYDGEQPKGEQNGPV
jgi:hypothetical protein